MQQTAETAVKYTSQNLRDPFRSPFEAGVSVNSKPGQSSPPGVTVQGLVWDSPHPQAIVNDTVVTKGAMVAGAEILLITKQGVHVLYEGQQYILRPQMSGK
ncbi:hypothetical protein ACFL1I_03600 [Candidatus Omnitrophota bacterium]